MTIDVLPIRALRVAVAIADGGSFAAAGRHLNLPRATISRVVGQLEERTGHRLFRRNTRKVVTTDAGEQLIAAARRALAEIDGALERASSQGVALSGPVRLSVSHAFGRHFVLPALASFRDAHPGVLIETLLQDRLDDMIDEDIDFTIRLGPLPESDLIVRRLGAFQSGLVAAPHLLAALDAPLDRTSLTSAPAIGFRIPGTGHVLPWPIRENDAITHAVLPQSVVLSDSIEAVRDLAAAGHGIALLPTYLIAPDLADGRLSPVCPDLVAIQTDVHICFRERRFMPARVRALIDHIAAEIATRLTH